jgi:hypothetical protein
MLDWLLESMRALQALISGCGFPVASVCVLLFVLYILFLCFTVYLLVAASNQVLF